MESLKPLGWQRETLDSPPFLIPPDQYQKQKDENFDSPSLLVFIQLYQEEKKELIF